LYKRVDMEYKTHHKWIYWEIVESISSWYADVCYGTHIFSVLSYLLQWCFWNWAHAEDFWCEILHHVPSTPSELFLISE